ncbi:MAG: site-specific integrase [Vicinamibacterales bacterium]
MRSKTGAQRWGEDRERHLLLHGRPVTKKEVPTLEEFAPRFIERHAVANRRKPSSVDSMRSIIRVHLMPRFGAKRLDAITTEQVQQLKGSLGDRAPKTVNNTLTVLNAMLKKAIEWEVLGRMPCLIRLLRVPRTTAGFHDFGDYEALVRASQEVHDSGELIVLLGGEAGLRCGEITALEWGDVDFTKRELCIERSEWKGHVTTPKGGRLRRVPMTARLTDALQRHRHRRGKRVLTGGDGRSFTSKMVTDCVRRAARRAGLTRTGIHILRHTFCSHLAMKGAPAKAIQDLAGHQELGTTQRYMHASPAALESAIRLLESSVIPPQNGDILETAEA